MSNVRCNEALPSAAAATGATSSIVNQKPIENDNTPSIAPFQPQQPSSSRGSPCRINGVKGYQNRTNSIIYCPPLLRPSPQQKCSAIVYFGGDVQDIPEKMESNRDNKNYIKWNLENTATLLRESFPQSHIIVVRPLRMEYSTFCCFDNFVRGNNAGIPDHTPMHYALQHLEELLISLTKKLTKPILDQELLHKLLAASNSKVAQPNSDSSCKRNNATNILQSNIYDGAGDETMSETANMADLLWWRENLNLDKASLKLIGFSKGCVVLNQFIYEFHYYKTLTPDDSTMMRLVSRITDMYWLDGGHGGGKNTWLTSRSLLETLCRLGINVHVHVTPYQIQDDHRPWIRKEEKAFTDLLKRLGAAFNRHLYPSEANSTNLYTHFDVLNRFRQHQVSLFTQQLAQSPQQQQQAPQPPATSLATGPPYPTAEPRTEDDGVGGGGCEYAAVSSLAKDDPMEVVESGEHIPPSDLSPHLAEAGEDDGQEMVN